MFALVIASPFVGSPALAHPDPDPDPDHGLNESTFHALWSGDNDTATVADTTPAFQALGQATDVPLDTPPRAVEQWNDGELREFPGTNATMSIHPPNASLTDGQFVSDAYTAIFAVQPSTRARLSPDAEPLYVASNGSVLATIDYRVDLPPETETERWYLDTHRIAEVRLFVDDTLETATPGGHAVPLDYAGLDGYAAGTHVLTVEANITVVVEQETLTCVEWANGTCNDRNWTSAFHTESVIVRDTIEVVPYSLTVSGFHARYPNGDRGFLVYKSNPWLGYSLPGGKVRGVWRFYSARDPHWDRLVTTTASGETTQHSPLHPLQVHAYPIETGPTASPAGTVTILETHGTTTPPPSLPDRVKLDVLTEPYTASYGIVTRTEAPGAVSELVAHGLVRGVSTAARPGSFAEIPIHPSNLTVTVVNTTAETITVRVHLREAHTGVPIETATREGHVVLAGERVNTSTDGTVTRTLARSTGGVSARFEPGRWWVAENGYAPDSDVVYSRGPVLSVLAVLSEILAPLTAVLVSIFFVDRITGWNTWPPWRRL